MRAVALAPQQLFIGGGWHDGDRTYSVEDPATGEVLCDVAAAGPAHALAALDAAAAAQHAWAQTPPRERSELLSAAFAAIRGQADRLAELISLESGKTLSEAHAEIAYGNEFLRWYAEEAVRPPGYYGVAPGGDKRVLTTVAPVGPALLITPWNFPLAMLTRKVGPALAAGCTAVVKPAGQTPLTALAFAALLADCGLPAGVLSVLPTDRSAELVDALLDDGRLRKLSFTGSTEVGRLLAARTGAGLIKTSMELGGNAPFLVFDDADMDRAVSSAVVAKLRNAGQSCIAANRFLVHAPVAEEFTVRLTQELSALRLGPGMEPGIDVGPVIDAVARDRLHELVERSRANGARVVIGGAAPEGPGYFYEPTLVTGVGPDSPLLSEEIFGPVAAITEFADEDEAVAQANRTDWGLVAYVHTSDIDRALRLGDRLEAGMVGINRGVVSEASAPFGGIDQSGLGREGGAEGLREYQEIRYLAVDL